MADNPLQNAVQALKAWQMNEDAAGRNRHGRCLEAVRFALNQLELKLPPPQPRPNNLAIRNGETLAANPAEFGWKAVQPTASRYTLEYFDHVGQLPDGRIAGHVGIVDHQAHIIFSSFDYPLTSGWQSKLFASFLPAGTAGNPLRIDLSPLEDDTGAAAPQVGAPAAPVVPDFSDIDKFIAPQPEDEDNEQ